MSLRRLSFVLVFFCFFIRPAIAADTLEGKVVKASGPRIYLIQRGHKRYVSQLAIAKKLGYRIDRIVKLTDAQLASYPDGTVLAPGPFIVDYNNQFLDGRVVQDRAGHFFVIENGLKRHIPDMATFTAFSYDTVPIIRVSDNVLSQFPPGNPLRRGQPHPDHTLIQGSSSKVYVILQGEKRWIINNTIFKAQGYSTEAILHFDDARIARIPEGPVINELAPNVPDTIILDGPPEGSTLERLDNVTLRYGTTTPRDRGVLTFETFLDGFDQQWISMGERTEESFHLPERDGVYTFYVRARDNKTGTVDPTPAKRQFRVELSALAPAIHLSGIHVNTDPNQEYVSITVDAKQTQPVIITGWTLEDERGRTHKIGQGIKMYYGTNDDIVKDVQVQAGDRIDILTGRSPLGSGFMLNHCMAYLRDHTNFFPSISSTCPPLNMEQILALDQTQACFSYMKHVPRCRQTSGLNGDESLSLGKTCSDYIQKHLSYIGCINDNYSQPDFFYNEWRLYLNSTDSIWDRQGILRLRDDKGRLVDEIRFGGY